MRGSNVENTMVLVCKIKLFMADSFSFILRKTQISGTFLVKLLKQKTFTEKKFKVEIGHQMINKMIESFTRI